MDSFLKNVHAIQPRPVSDSRSRRPMSKRVTTPSTLMPSFCFPFKRGCRAAVPSRDSSAVWSSKHMSAATWQSIQAGSTGGCVYMSMRLRPSTCLYKVREEGPRTRRTCGRWSVGLTVIDTSSMSSRFCCYSSCIMNCMQRQWDERRGKRSLPHRLYGRVLHSTGATRPRRPNLRCAHDARRRTAAQAPSRPPAAREPHPARANRISLVLAP
jgi:hypothetical protein